MGKSSRMRWEEICAPSRFGGRWVALDNVRYDPSTAQPLEGDVVDADEDLGSLCARMRELDRTSCAVLFCEEPMAPLSLARHTSRFGARTPRAVSRSA